MAASQYSRDDVREVTSKVRAPVVIFPMGLQLHFGRTRGLRELTSRFDRANLRFLIAIRSCPGATAKLRGDSKSRSRTVTMGERLWGTRWGRVGPAARELLSAESGEEASSCGLLA